MTLRNSPPFLFHTIGDNGKTVLPTQDSFVVPTQHIHATQSTIHIPLTSRVNDSPY